MGRNGVAKAVVSAAIMMSLGLLLGGCVATVGNIAVHAAAAGRAAIAEKGKPHRGDCWRADYKDVDGYANWGDQPAVACSEPHQLYTFGVPALTGVHQSKLFDNKGYAYRTIEDDAYETCLDAENTDLSSTDPTVARIYVLPILPEEPQWNAGARWVRCDVGVLEVGSSVAHPSFERLPASETLYTELRDGASQFDFCVNEPVASDRAARKAAMPSTPTAGMHRNGSSTTTRRSFRQTTTCTRARLR